MYFEVSDNGLVDVEHHGDRLACSTVCSACEANGRDKQVRVRKAKKTYFRDCQVCGTSELIWTEV